MRAWFSIFCPLSSDSRWLICGGPHMASFPAMMLSPITTWITAVRVGVNDMVGAGKLFSPNSTTARKSFGGGPSPSSLKAGLTGILSVHCMHTFNSPAPLGTHTTTNRRQRHPKHERLTVRAAPEPAWSKTPQAAAPSSRMARCPAGEEEERAISCDFGWAWWTVPARSRACWGGHIWSALEKEDP
jgi:hypothetical protein